MITRKSDARWEGDLKGGKGSIKLGSGAFEGSYSAGSRFETAKGTNPEELLGAAHAACFSMAFALGLSNAGFVPKSVATTATVSMDRTEAGMTITGIALETQAEVPGVSDADFQRIGNETKSGCIISRALASVPMTLSARNAG